MPPPESGERAGVMRGPRKRNISNAASLHSNAEPPRWASRSNQSLCQHEYDSKPVSILVRCVRHVSAWEREHRCRSAAPVGARAVDHEGPYCLLAAGR